MTYTVGALSPGPSCEINKLIVQVVGKDHPGTQRLAFYERDTTKRLDAITAQDRPETVTMYMCAPSRLHVWDWSGEPGHRMMLEVETDDGPPILLPLPPVGITLRQLDRQHNQIVPVLPFVALPGIHSAHDHGTPVLCRPGFIYVFLGNRLWRELEVRITDERTTYHDIELDKFRLGNQYVDDARLATGKGLDDIWLPANWNDQPLDVQLCFSEVQLNHERIKRLEQDRELRRQRCQRPDLRVSKEASTYRFRARPDGAAMLQAFSAFDAFDADNQSQAGLAHATWLNLNRHAFPLSIPAAQRARQPGFEWMLDQPAHYLCDLSGEFLATVYREARQHVLAGEKGNAANLLQRIETGAWAQRLEQILKPDAEYNCGLWQVQPPATDVLSDARARHLHGVMLKDTHYRLHHLNTRIQEQQQQLLKMCGARAQQHAHHGSALLVQQLIVPTSIGGQKNPLHQQLDDLKEQGRLDINRFTATGERMQLWRSLAMSQSLLCECLQELHTEHSLADYMSLDGFEYAASLYFISQLFVTLALQPAAYDTLAVNGGITDAMTGLSLYNPEASVGQRWISKVINDPQHPVHKMLWPDTGQQNLNAPYQAPSTPDVNQGDGCFRATELAKTEHNGPFPVRYQSDINSWVLAGLLDSGNLQTTLTAGAKAGAAALIAAHENLQGAIEAAEHALHGTPPGMGQATQNKTRQPSVAVQERGLAQLRSMLPHTFGDLRWLPRADAHHQGYYVFGLDDLPGQASRVPQPYGVYRNEYGPLEIPAQRHGYSEPPQLSPDRMVLGIPSQHPTAIAVRETNRRVNEAWQQELLENAADQSQKLNTLESAAQQSNATRSHWAFRALDSLPFAGAVVMLELWNVRNELEAAQQAAREKSAGRVIFGYAGAGFDLAIAMEALTVKLAGSNAILTMGRKTLFTIPDASAQRLLGSLSNRLVKKYSGRLLAQVSAGLLFVGLNLYDAWYSYQWNDDAYIGHLLMAAGGLMGVTGSVLSVGTTFLGLTPLGWASLLLITVGAAAIYLFSSSPIEDWLKNGPFGADPHNAAEHLRDPQTAFYYLVSLLANIRISISPNPKFKVYATLDDRDTLPFEVRSANTRIRIESNLAGLMNGLGKPGIKAFCALDRIESFYDRHGGQTHQSIKSTAIHPTCHRLLPDALELLVTTPHAYPAELEVDLPYIHHRWRVRAQLSINADQRTWVFPAPPPKDPTPFGPAYAKPDFEDIGRLFWADETKNKARAVK